MCLNFAGLMLVSLQNISFFFGARPILEDASWQIERGERIGLVGSNGAGKSTLLRIITGAYKIDAGIINKPKDVTLGFFNQDLLSFSTSNSILSVGMQAFERAHELETEMARLLNAVTAVTPIAITSAVFMLVVTASALQMPRICRAMGLLSITGPNSTSLTLGVDITVSLGLRRYFVGQLLEIFAVAVGPGPIADQVGHASRSDGGAR